MDLKSQEQCKISLAHLTALGCPPPELTYLAHRTGFDYVSFRVIQLDLSGEPNYELARNPAMLRETKAALRSTGLKVLDVELARIKDGVDVRTYIPTFGGSLRAASGECDQQRLDNRQSLCEGSVD